MKFNRLLTDLKKIETIAAEKEDENDRFRIFLKQQDEEYIDSIVHALNEQITAQIDCTQCGNCCKSLMINVSTEEIALLATEFQTSPADVKERYIEESDEGQLIINSIPCHFLSGTTCSIYEHRFTDCRDFPHLHKPGFTRRLFGTLMNYAICPIIFNVVEKLKPALNFNTDHPQQM
ncbi:MAG: YkgJ family cysteine cluster protein [Ferruginibacter sp.]|nr:YkgJ family cysteine cluster protein [Ferruginibacter sp.]